MSYPKSYPLTKGELTFLIGTNHRPELINYRYFQITQFRGNDLFGSIFDIYLRDRKNNEAYSLFEYATHYVVNEDKYTLSGEIKNVKFTLTLFLVSDHLWFHILDLEGNAKDVDVLYVQDVGLGDKNALLNNELYVSQYLDHKIFKENGSYVIASRQNLTAPHLTLVQGALGEAVTHYATDAMQWLGTDYKITGVPTLLNKDLPNVNYQYELATIALQTKRFNLYVNKRLAFYAYLIDDQTEPLTDLSFIKEINEKFISLPATLIKGETNEKKPLLQENLCKLPVNSKNLTTDELKNMFGEILFPEYQDDKLLSFFTKDYAHVILKEKERQTERPSGHIITSLGKGNELDLDLLTSTNYSYGLFNAQLVAGNTSMNKLLSVNRGLLNTEKISGQRIWIKFNNKYQELGVPSAYELGVNYAKWYYALPNDDLLLVTVFMSPNNQVNMEITSQNDVKYDFLLTHQIVMGEHEYINDFTLNRNGQDLIFGLDSNSFQSQRYPDLTYKMHIENKDFEVNDDSVFYKDEVKRDPSLFTLKFNNVANVRLTIQGTIGTKELGDGAYANFKESKELYKNYYNDVLNGFKIHSDTNEEITKFDIIARWFAHNALVHYAVPHGLEQSGGAAWGTRDVSQGPMEFFLATGEFDRARDTLKRLFAYQNIDNGTWPQWFFFDKYGFAADSAHGDIIFWPLKALANYLKVSEDIDFLDELIPYFNNNTKETLTQHIAKTLDGIEKRIILSFNLVTYAGGDWDDTLQPAQKKMEERFVSTWTQALAYQTLNELHNVLPETYTLKKRIEALKKVIKDGFDKYAIKDDVLAGFIEITDEGTIKYLLHPRDEETGIHYRLIPMTRSIISELVNKEEADNFDKIIDKTLHFADGIRLMDHPASYNGGFPRHFLRAELASNVGREISLLYTHAHIRYIEAEAQMGNAEKAYHALLQVIPIDLKSVVPNASLRQANAYFSSSDGYFMDRYQYDKEFDRLKTGDIPVRGGWRIYSSGPGIYMRILLNDILGLQLLSDGLIIDPVVSPAFDGAKVNFNLMGKCHTFTYHVNKNQVNEVEVYYNGKKMEGEKVVHRYRYSGLRILFAQINDEEKRNWDIFLK